MPALGLLVSAVLLASCPPARPVRIAEVLYDATGDDRGLEFVELLNVGTTPVALAGVRIEAGDGSGPGRWSTRWIGAASDTVPPLGRFVVGGDRVPEANAHATLDLQNGPDAVRLAWPDGGMEVVGYGALEWGEYFCGAPAPDAPSGMSLARVPDSSDAGSNALDFRAATPSPGRANQARRNLTIVPGSLRTAPEQPEPGAPFTVSLIVHDPGADAVAEAEGAVRVMARESGEELGASPLPALAPGDSARVEVAARGVAAGRWTLAAALALAGDEIAADDGDSLVIRIGAGPLEITEVQFHPASGEGEWVEVRNLGDQALRLDAFTISDRGTARGAPQSDRPLASGSYGLLVQDAAAFLRAYPDADTARVWAARPWASLNNSDDASGVADVVVLREADGTPCDRHEYSARGVPAGVPIERAADGVWQPALDARGTPLAPPRTRPEVPGRFRLARSRVVAGDGSERCAWSLPWPRARVAVDVYDLAGRAVARVAHDREATGRGELEWDAGALGPGLYLVVLRARREGGEERVSVTRALRVEGAP
jgi:hypothetical protein